MGLRSKYMAELARNRGLTNIELARRLGVSREQVGRWLNGTATDMRWSNAQALAKELGVPLDSLFDFDDGSHPANVFQVSEDAVVYQMQKVVPIVGMVGAADSSLNLSFEDGGYPPGFGPFGAVEVPMRDPAAFALKVIGDSMEPGVPEGAIVVVAERPHIEGALSVVQALDGRAWLKRLRRVNGSYLLESFNATAYPSFLLKLEEVRQVWRVIWIRFPS